MSFNLTLGEWISINITQTLITDEYWYTIRQQGEEVFKRKNTKPNVFHHVYVYASNPWDYPLEGIVQNLVVITSHGRHLGSEILVNLFNHVEI